MFQSFGSLRALAYEIQPDVLAQLKVRLYWQLKSRRLPRAIFMPAITNQQRLQFWFMDLTGKSSLLASPWNLRTTMFTTFSGVDPFGIPAVWLKRLVIHIRIDHLV